MFARGIRPRDIAVDVLAFVLVCLGSFVPINHTGAVQHGWTALPFLAAAGLVLFARRRHPIVVLVICVLIASVAGLLGAAQSPGLTLPVAIAMYSVARYRSRRVTLWIAAALIVLLPVQELLISGAVFGAGQLIEPATVQPAVLVAFSAALGSAIQSYFVALEAARERAREAEESREAEARRRVAEDRLSIARDLHDSVAHRIAVINLQAGVAARTLRDDPGIAEAAVGIVGDAARTVLAELRDMLGLLRANTDRDIADEPDFAHLDGLLALFAQSGLKVAVQTFGAPQQLSQHVGAVAYRVVQEALTNAFKYGADRTASLEILHAPDTMTIIVTNPIGRTSLSETGGHGLIGMRERLLAVGGELDTTRACDRFTLTARIPNETDPS